MSFSPKQKKSISILLFAAFFLLAANIFWEIIFEKPERYGSPASADSVKSNFMNLIKSFAIEDKWIAENDNFLKNKYPDADQHLKIKIPADLPIINIVQELYFTFAKKPFQLKSYEINRSGEAEVILSEQEEPLIAAKFIYDTLISRDAGSVAFVLHSLNELTTEEDSALLHLPASFAVTLIPSGKSAEELGRISSLRKECVLLLNDEITELQYRMDKNMSLQRLKLVLRTIVENFSKVAFIVVTPDFPLLQSSLYIEMIRYFNDRKIKVINSSSLLTLDELTEPGKILREILMRTGKDDSAVFFCTAETYTELKDDINEFKKTGYKFLRPSEILLK
ncbi:MAG: hypothetical protein Kow0098_27960 [Ignavibacteriaceae bacterium]